MRRLTLLAILLLGPLFAYAQNTLQSESPENGGGKEEIDMTYAGQADVDSVMLGRNIFSVLKHSDSYREGTIEVEQSQAVQRAMESHVAANASKKVKGYRVRIFFDNGQNARVKSESVAGSFKARHPGVEVYRDYENPYFRVTVGNFRTKRDATVFLNTIKSQYPAGFIVRENMQYPML